MLGLSSLAVFVSAFLLFAVQPMVAKMLLPSMGGAAAVWNTAMVFYQAVLLLGYLYAHGVVRLGKRVQVAVHALVLLLPFIVLPLAYRELTPPTGSHPAAWMLGLMAVTVGLPFFALSATSPLVQTWFARAGGGDPYFLYAASNVGSFAGLLAYPFFIEPRFGVAQQSGWWTWGYAALVLVFGGLMWRMSSRASTSNDSTEANGAVVTGAHSIPSSTGYRTPLWRRIRWVLLAFVPSSLFMGVTTYLTTDIAVMPMLWVIPLGVYLLSMVFVFARRRPISHRFIVATFPFILAGLVFLVAAKIGQFRLLAFGAHLVALFWACMLCHGELAEDRPESDRLTEFFLWMSLGGVLGGVFNALVAPAVFKTVAEYPLMLGLVALALPVRDGRKTALACAWDAAIPIVLITIAMAFFWQYRQSWPAMSYGWVTGAIGGVCLFSIVLAKRPWRFAITIGGVLALGAYITRSDKDLLFADRSFFGVYQVEKYLDSHLLQNGRILHGEQIMRPAMQDQPLSYYHQLGPLREVLGAWPRPPAAHVAAIGLGIGTVALWSRQGENWTFFEIDPVVERVARDTRLFTCLAKARGNVGVTIGDARLRLKESTDRFDVILVDAFSSDAIPVHLMTLEAVRLYGERLAPNGLLAVHISNKFLDLEPLVAAIANELGLASYICDESKEPVEGPMLEGRTEASWIVLGPKNRDWTPITRHRRWKPARRKPGVEAWTDAYSSLLPVLRKSAFRLR